MNPCLLGLACSDYTDVILANAIGAKFPAPAPTGEWCRCISGMTKTFLFFLSKKISASSPHQSNSTLRQISNFYTSSIFHKVAFFHFCCLFSKILTKNWKFSFCLISSTQNFGMPCTSLKVVLNRNKYFSG